MGERGGRGYVSGGWREDVEGQYVDGDGELCSVENDLSFFSGWSFL